jgi:hypothetical protein
MPGHPKSSDSSFIPKQGPVKRRRQAPAKRLYLLTIISYILIFAALISAGGVFFYSLYIKSEFNKVAIALAEDVKSFVLEDMLTVQDFDRRLLQASGRMEASASVLAVFEALEEATLESVYIESFGAMREGDDFLKLSISFSADTFDSVVFQRKMYGDNTTMNNSFNIVSFQPEVGGNSEDSVSEEEGLVLPDASGQSDTEITSVSFEVEVTVPLEDIPVEAARWEKYEDLSAFSATQLFSSSTDQGVTFTSDE